MGFRPSPSSGWQVLEERRHLVPWGMLGLQEMGEVLHLASVLSARSLEVNQMPSCPWPNLPQRRGCPVVTVEHLDPRVWLRGVARARRAGDPKKRKRCKEKESHAQRLLACLPQPDFLPASFLLSSQSTSLDSPSCVSCPPSLPSRVFFRFILCDSHPGLTLPKRLSEAARVPYLHSG